VSLTTLFPAPAFSEQPESVDIDGPNARLELEQLYRPAHAEWLRLNLVSSLSGSAVGSDGTSQGLTTRTDRRILGAIRRLSDVVLIGAATIRHEGYLLPRTAVLAVVTASGDLGGHTLPTTLEPGRLIVLCPPAVAGRVRASLSERPADIVTIADRTSHLAAPDIIAALRNQGLLSIVCEGGPNLAAQLLSADLVDEICLTTSPVVNGGAVPIFGREELREKRVELAQLLVDESSTLYARWSVAASPATP
jgi:riboflavin biosynthesis pyrimidine reductase